jgi:hypothetical protein
VGWYSRKKATRFGLGFNNRRQLGLLLPHTLSPKYYGSYQVMQEIGEVAYKLQLPSRTRIHDVFHFSLLKKYEGPAPAAVVPLPDILHGKVLPSPDKVLRARLNRGVWKILVKWTGRSEADTIWEQLDEFKQQFPCIKLADELFVKCYRHFYR